MKPLLLEEDPFAHTKAPLIQHLQELRTRLLYTASFFLLAFIISYIYADKIYAFLVEPLAHIYAGEHRRLIYTGLTEAFFTYMKLAFFMAAFLSFPMVASQIYIFLAPGLYKHEKKVILPYLVATPVLFLMGAAIVYYLIFPMAWKFFLSFETAALPGEATLPVQLEAKVSEYLSLVMHLVMAFGIAFQLPVLLTLLARAGLVSHEGLVKKRRYAIVIIFAIAAVITPPDVISQIGLAVPMVLLYELSIIACKRIGKKEAESM